MLVTELLHVGGGVLASRLPLPASTSSQAMGSALTYLRRYSLVGLVGVAPDRDDDGESAEQQHRKRQRPVAQRAPQSHRSVVHKPIGATAPPMLSESELTELEAFMRDAIADAATLAELDAIAKRLADAGTPEALRNRLRDKWLERRDELASKA